MRGETNDLRIPTKSLYGKRDGGRLVVTDKRLVLVRKNRDPIAFFLHSLGQVECYVNGLRVSLPDHHSLYLNAGRGNKTLFSLLFRLLNPGESLGS
jgi:hypothetical protein